MLLHLINCRFIIINLNGIPRSRNYISNKWSTEYTDNVVAKQSFILHRQHLTAALSVTAN